jgi:hypothetical protein
MRSRSAPMTRRNGFHNWRANFPPVMRRVAGAGALLCTALLIAAGAQADVVSQGNLQVAAFGRLEPNRLPRDATAPISVFIAGSVGTTDGSTPPQLQGLSIKLNRHGVLRPDGLPVCRIEQIQPASTERALQDCGGSLIGAGQFWAEIVLPGQAPYRTEGRLLAFNGREGSRPVVFVHIFTSNPFFNSFVITFSMHHVSQGPYGTELRASLPQALGSWGYVNRIKMTLSRKFSRGGRQLSYFNASCPAAKGFPTANFQLAQADFDFEGHKPLVVSLTRPCSVRK